MKSRLKGVNTNVHSGEIVGKQFFFNSASEGEVFFDSEPLDGPLKRSEGWAESDNQKMDVAPSDELRSDFHQAFAGKSSVHDPQIA